MTGITTAQFLDVNTFEYYDNDNNLILIVLDKFSEKEDDFTDIIMFVLYKNQEVKIRRHLSPLSKDMFNEVIKLVTT